MNKSNFTNPISFNFWSDRYRKNDETYDENLIRVASFISKAEKEENQDKWEKEFYNIMKQGLFFPAGRTMSNAGIGRHLTLNNCFLSGTKILTSHGEKNIEDIKIGDMVVTHENTFEKVLNTMSRPYSGDMYKITLQTGEQVICTPNHKFSTNKGWVAAEDLIPIKSVNTK